MGLWIAVFAAAIAAVACAYIFLIRHFHKFKAIQRLGERHRALAWLVSAVPVLALTALLPFDVVNVMVVFIHLMLIWAVCDLIGRFTNGLRGVKLSQKSRYTAGAVAIALTVAYLGYGVISAYDVCETHYDLTTEKDAHLRILQVSDSHVGATFDGEGFAKHMQKAQECNPDVVVITGDFVDDDTTRADMELSAEALGALTSTYGTYFVYGNHDEGYFNERDFSAADLEGALERNGVVILRDEAVELAKNVLLIGRLDKSMPNRASWEQLMTGVSPEAYVIALDHQPCDYAEQERLGTDLVLSGHTHGGQMIPIGQVSELLGINDAIYGLQHRGASDFIVSSGIGDWAFKFKTGTISEYVVIDVNAAV